MFSCFDLKAVKNVAVLFHCTSRANFVLGDGNHEPVYTLSSLEKRRGKIAKWYYVLCA